MIILYRILVSFLLFGLFIVLIQDFLIFPGLYSSYLFNRSSTPPEDVKEIKLTATDGQKITAWQRPISEDSDKTVAILFHGNAEYLSNYVEIQRWLGSLGVSSYSMEYRGYNGRSSGWPSEKGFYDDASTLVEYVMKKEGIKPEQILIFGSSIGSGVASYVAEKYQVGTLLLLSPYSNLKKLVSEMPLYGLFTPFLKYEFPVSDYISRLKSTRLIIAHGKKDTTIPFSHSEEVKNSYKGTKGVELISSPDAGHNDLMFHVQRDLAKSLLEGN